MNEVDDKKPQRLAPEGDDPFRSQKRQKQPHKYGWDEKWTSFSKSKLLFEFIQDENVKKGFESFLKENDVETLGKLRDKTTEIFLSLPEELEKKLAGKFLTELGVFLEDRKDLVSMLHGQFLNVEASGLPQHDVQSDIFEHDLEKIRGARSTAENRNDPYMPIVVSGSSGSGKTTFAGTILPKAIAPDTVEDSIHFCVYLKGSNVTNSNKAKDQNEMAKCAVSWVRHLITSFAEQRNFCVPDSFFPIKNTHLLVVIDELGIDDDAKYVDTGDKLACLGTKLQAQIAHHVQLVLVGTGLDLITTKVNTDVEAVKVRVKPWKPANVLALGKALAVTNSIECLLSEQPIFCDLGTNARAAKFLVEALKKYRGVLFPISTVLVDMVVKDVAFRYINSNGLSQCDSGRRRNVARFALSTLRKVKRGQAEYQEIDCDDMIVKRVARGLMDFHVETVGSQRVLIPDECYAVTVSPAITIVLSALMGALETFSATWEGLERVGALDALGSLIISSKEKIVPAMGIVLSSFPFPATVSKNRVKVPVLEKNVVLRNGRGAPHADVISFYRFGQFKKVQDADSYASLDINKEFSNMGVLKKSSYEGEAKEDLANRLMTQCLIEQWKELDKSTDNNSGPTSYEAWTQSSTAKEQNQWTKNEGKVRLLYPFSQMQLHARSLSVDFRKEPLKMNDLKDLGEILPQNKKIVVAFATNGIGFKLSTNCKQGIEVRRQHVDDNGNLLKQEEDRLKCIWEALDQDRIDLRFLMCDP